jgi:hypothetical protein
MSPALHPPAIVEAQTEGDDLADMTGRALRLRLRQQEILAELGVLALKGVPFSELIDHTAILTAEGLQAEFSKVLEFLPAQNRLLVRAGVGWDAGVVGAATVGADLESPAGFALQTGKPGAVAGTWHSSGDECHPAGRRTALWCSGGRQPIERRVHRT